MVAQSPEKYCQNLSINQQPKVESIELSSYYTNYQNSFADEYDGSYQIIITGNIKMTITTETLDIIKSNREKASETIVELGSGIKVRILSSKSVKSKKTIPLNQMYILE